MGFGTDKLAWAGLSIAPAGEKFGSCDEPFSFIFWTIVAGYKGPLVLPVGGSGQLPDGLLAGDGQGQERKSHGVYSGRKTCQGESPRGARESGLCAT